MASVAGGGIEAVVVRLIEARWTYEWIARCDSHLQLSDDWGSACFISDAPPLAGLKGLRAGDASRLGRKGGLEKQAAALILGLMRLLVRLAERASAEANCFLLVDETLKESDGASDSGRGASRRT